PVRFALERRRNDFEDAVSCEWPVPRQHLIEHTPKGPDIGAFVDRLPTSLFRTHVGRGPEHDTLHCTDTRGATVGDAECTDAGGISFAIPRSSSFTVRSAVSLIFCGFRPR